MKDHGTCKDATENYKLLFRLILIFLHFLPNFEDFQPILADFDKLQCNEMKNLISIVE